MKRAVALGVGVGLMGVSWVLLGAMALGNRFISPIPRNDEARDDYV